jgi:hypothetical protein
VIDLFSALRRRCTVKQIKTAPKLFTLRSISSPSAWGGGLEMLADRGGAARAAFGMGDPAPILGVRRPRDEPRLHGLAPTLPRKSARRSVGSSHDVGARPRRAPFLLHPATLNPPAAWQPDPCPQRSSFSAARHAPRRAIPRRPSACPVDGALPQCSSTGQAHGVAAPAPPAPGRRAGTTLAARPRRARLVSPASLRPSAPAAPENRPNRSGFRSGARINCRSLTRN